MPIKRAALYIRVSSEEQARHGLSLGEQRADLLSYAESHNYAVVGVYADEGVSARKSYRSRRELQRLLRDVEDGQIDIIVMKCLDRWFRNVKDYYKVQEILDAHGVLWECTQDRYDTTTAAGRLNLHIRLAIAEEESDRTGERIRYVFNGKRDRHEILTGFSPLGYKVVDKHLVPDETTVPIVRYIFQYISEGNSGYSVPAMVERKFGYDISYWRVYMLLRNRTYIGERYGIPDYCPGIVDADLFERVQGMFSKTTFYRTSKRVFLFGGLVHCPHCGKVMAGALGTKYKGEYRYLYYRCQFRSLTAPSSRCPCSRTIFETKIERYLLDNLQSMISSHIYAVEHCRPKDGHEEESIDSLNAKLTRLKDLYVDGLIDKDTYRADYDKLQQKISEAARAADFPKVRPALREIANEKDFRSTYESLSRENKRAFWHSIIERIDFDDTPENRGRGKTIHFRATFF